MTTVFIRHIKLNGFKKKSHFHSCYIYFHILKKAMIFTGLSSKSIALEIQEILHEIVSKVAEGPELLF